MTPNVPTIESGTATLGMMVAERLRRNRKITMTTRPTVSISSNCTSRDGGADGGGAVGEDLDIDRRGQGSFELRAAGA